MSTRARALLELAVAVAAVVGCVACWLLSRSTEMAPPVAANEPSQVSVVYDPPLVALALVFATVAGVLAVVGGARLRGFG